MLAARRGATKRACSFGCRPLSWRLVRGQAGLPTAMTPAPPQPAPLGSPETQPYVAVIVTVSPALAPSRVPPTVAGVPPLLMSPPLAAASVAVQVVPLSVSPAAQVPAVAGEGWGAGVVPGVGGGGAGRGAGGPVDREGAEEGAPRSPPL